MKVYISSHAVLATRQHVQTALDVSQHPCLPDKYGSNVKCQEPCFRLDLTLEIGSVLLHMNLDDLDEMEAKIKKFRESVKKPDKEKKTEWR